jgi:hypothetical protein
MCPNINFEEILSLARWNFEQQNKELAPLIIIMNYFIITPLMPNDL